MLKTMNTPIEQKNDPSWTRMILLGVPLFMAIFAFGGDIGKWIGGIVLALLLIGTAGMFRRTLVLMYAVFLVFIVVAGLELAGRPLQ